MSNKIFVVIDANGFPTSFWQSAAYPEDATPPEGAVQITEGQFADAYSNQGQRRWNGSGFGVYEPPRAKASSADVDAERERRIAEGFSFQGNVYQAREQDLRNINGAATGAAVAVMGGAQPGDFRWVNSHQDFAWIAADNSLVTMDAHTVIRFGLAAMAWVSSMTFAGRAIKDRLLAGEDLDITADSLWPASVA